MVASDGAGTAALSDRSSKMVATEFAGALIDIAAELAIRPPGAWVTDAVIEEVVRLRKKLRAESKSDDISAYHCTLVAALMGPTGGLTVHLGDGAVFGGIAGARSTQVIDLADDYVVSAPQNGEYANETVFLTERDWLRNLRIQPVHALDWVILGTDGGMSLAMVGEKTPKSGFVVPVLNELLAEPDAVQRSLRLEAILKDKQADSLTNDDKTLVIAVRGKFASVTGEFKIDRASQTSARGPTAPAAGTAAAQANHAEPEAATGKQAGATTQAALSKKKLWLMLTAGLVLATALTCLTVYSVRALSQPATPPQDRPPTKPRPVHPAGDATLNRQVETVPAPASPPSAASALTPALD